LDTFPEKWLQLPVSLEALGTAGFDVLWSEYVNFTNSFV
jgi:hypothetical protein